VELRKLSGAATAPPIVVQTGGGHYNPDREQVKEYGLDGKLKVEFDVVDRLEPEAGAKFKRVVSKVEGVGKTCQKKQKCKSWIGARSTRRPSKDEH